MKITTPCANCKNPIPIKGQFNDRGEIRRELGETFLVQCPECLLNQSTSAEHCRAREYRHERLVVFLITFSMALGICWLIYAYLFDGLNTGLSIKALSIATIPATVYGIYVKQKLASISRFNRYY